MKSVALLLCCIALMASLPIASAQTAKVQSVYLLPMTGGLDQFLANRLTSGGVVQVVTDPKKAEAVLTDQLGEVFEKRLADLYPAEAPAASETKTAGAVSKTKAAAGTESKAAAGSEKSEKEETATDSEAAEEARKTREKPVRVFSSGRARGTLFLVDTHSRNVIWSVFEKPKNTTAEQMDRTARRIAERLKKDLTGGK